MQLVINRPGTFITCKDDCFRLKNKDDVFDISPQKIESMVVSNKAMITSQAIVQALEHNVDVIFLDGYGDPIGRIWFAKMGSTALIRRRQLEAAQGEEGTALVLEMIRRKLENQIGFLKRLMHARPGTSDPFDTAIQIVEASLQALEKERHPVEDVRDRLLGLEGTAGRAYFQCLAGILPEKYRFKGRSRRPAHDPFNAALNYCYGILYSRVEKALMLSGLDPFIGFMHTDNYNKKSLVFDFIEPFRIYAEQTTVYLFTGKKMKDDFFDRSEPAVSLNRNGKPVVVEAMNRHLDESVRYRRKNVKRRHIIQHEAHRMAAILLEGSAFERPDWLEIKTF